MGTFFKARTLDRGFCHMALRDMFFSTRQASSMTNKLFVSGSNRTVSGLLAKMSFVVVILLLFVQFRPHSLNNFLVDVLLRGKSREFTSYFLVVLVKLYASFHDENSMFLSVIVHCHVLIVFKFFKNNNSSLFFQLGKYFYFF